MHFNNQLSPPKLIRPLFRQQALTHMSSKQYGTVMLTKSVGFRVLTGMFALIALTIIAFFALFSTTRKAHTSGVLLPDRGVIRVIALQNGVVVEKLVKEGQLVKAGEVLYVLRSERLGSRGLDRMGSYIDAQKEITGLIAQRRDSLGLELKQSNLQTRQRVEAIKQRLVDVSAQAKQVDAQIELQARRVSLSEKNAKRYKDLHATQFVSAAQLQDREAELIDQQQRLVDLERVQASHQRELASARAELNDARFASIRERAALKRNMAGMEQDLVDNETQREFVIVAAQGGVVTATTAELGQTVAINQALAMILPEGSKLEAEIYAPSRSIGFVRPGMKVLLRYQAYPYQKFGQHAATVREVANTSSPPEELALHGGANGAGGEPVYRMRLDLDKQDILAYGKSMPLKSGMLVDASILLEERRLYEWVLEPLFSISGRM